jgi:hypothetical protein
MRGRRTSLATTYAVAVTAAFIVTACGGDATPTAPVVAQSESLPREPASMLMPAHAPAGLRLEYAQGVPPPEDSEGYMSAYTRPGAEGMILAVSNTGSDSGPFLPDERTPGFRRTTVRGMPAASGRIGDDSWLVWFPPDADQEQDQLAIIGRGVAEDVVARAAKAARVDGARITVPLDALPDGFVHVASAPVGIAHLDRPLPVGITLSYRGEGGAQLVLQVAAADETLARLLGLVAVGRPAAVRGVTGVEGPAVANGIAEAGVARAQVRTWSEPGVVAVVVSRGVRDAVVDDFVRGLAVRPASELSKLTWTFRDVRVESLLAPGHQLAVSGTLPDGVWGIGVFETAGRPNMETVGLRPSGRVFGGAGDATVDPGKVTGQGAEGAGDGTLLFGTVPARAARVVVNVDSGAVTAELGPAIGGARWFGAWVGRADVTAWTATAYDALGHAVGSAVAG